MTAERTRGGLSGVGFGLVGACFILGFSLPTVLAHVSHDGSGQAAELVSAQILAASSQPVAKAWIEGFEFSPDRIKVAKGTTVLWTNRDGSITM